MSDISIARIEQIAPHGTSLQMILLHFRWKQIRQLELQQAIQRENYTQNNANS